MLEQLYEIGTIFLGHTGGSSKLSKNQAMEWLTFYYTISVRNTVERWPNTLFFFLYNMMTENLILFLVVTNGKVALAFGWGLLFK